MWEVGPCAETSTMLRMFNAVLNVVQTVLVAYIAQRAVRKNRDEYQERKRRSEEI